jgi:hypothetical protein
MHTGWTSICSDDAKKAVHAKGLEALLSEVKLQFIIAAHLPKLAAGLMSDNFPLLTLSHLRVVIGNDCDVWAWSV